MYTTNLYIYDKTKEKKLDKNSALENFYKPVDSRFKLWNLIDTMPMEELLLAKVVCFEDTNYEIKGVVPSINIQNSFTKKVYLKECSTKKLKR